MDGQNRIGVAQLPAAVDHFLGAALHFRIAALYRVEVQVFGIGAGIHAGCRATAQTDEHARSAQMDQQRAGGELLFEAVGGVDVAHPARQHDGLVVAAHLACAFFLERAEITRQIRPAEFVVERCCAERAVDHDLQRGGDAVGLAVTTRVALIDFPWLVATRDVQVGHREPAQPGLGLGTGAGGALVANLAARTRCRTGERRNRGGVIVRFHLHQDVRTRLTIYIATIFRRMKTRHVSAFDHRGIIRIRHHGPLRMTRVGFADHAEQRVRLRLAVNHPGGVENLVAAVL